MAVKPIVFYTRPDAAKPVVFYGLSMVCYTNTGGDGFITDSNTFDPGRTWNDIRIASTGTLSGAEEYTLASAAQLQPGHFWIQRLFIPFDTSTIPDGVEILSAEIGLYCYDGLGLGDICLTQSTQTNPESLVAEDYNNITLDSPPEGASRIDADSDGLGTSHKFILNSTGIGWINKAGWTKFCIRAAWDVDDYEPIMFQQNSGKYCTEEYYQSNGEYRPYLKVMYNPIVFYTGETP